MFRSTAPLATDRHVFDPHVVTLDTASDGLSAFCSESAGDPRPVPAQPAPLPRARTARGRRIRLRVPSWLGAGSLAIVTGGLSGVLIASLFQTPVVALPTAGAVTITSEPPAMPVRVDGVLRGATPFATMLAPGSHRVEIGAGPDARVRQLQVRPGSEALVHVAMPAVPVLAAAEPSAARVDDARRAFVTEPRIAPVTAPAVPAPDRGPATVRAPAPAPAPARAAAVVRPPTGTLSVDSPFPVRVLVDGEEVGTSATARLPVPAGTHTVTLVNERLEFEQAQELSIVARRSQALTVDPPLGTLHVNAEPWAQVLVDGRRAGDTPIGNLSLAVGEHEIVLRHPELGEERRTVTVGARTPVRVGVEFTR